MISAPAHQTTRPTARLSPRATALGLSVLAATLLTAFFVTPAQTPWLPYCPFLQLTGFYCPGCGVTRMLHLLAHGHPWLALRQNSLAFLALAAVVLALLLRAPLPTRLSRAAILAILAVLTLFTLARNLPVEPFCALAPGGACPVRALGA